MTEKQDIGHKAEQIAADYLREKGFSILDMNWRSGSKELDIVAEKDDMIHVVEVRSLTTAFFQQPYQTIGFAKQRNLLQAVNAYMERHKVSKEVQLDVISVVFSGANYKLEYLPNAIYPKA